MLAAPRRTKLAAGQLGSEPPEGVEEAGAASGLREEAGAELALRKAHTLPRQGAGIACRACLVSMAARMMKHRSDPQGRAQPGVVDPDVEAASGVQASSEQPLFGAVGRGNPSRQLGEETLRGTVKIRRN